MVFKQGDKIKRKDRSICTFIKYEGKCYSRCNDKEKCPGKIITDNNEKNAVGCGWSWHGCAYELITPSSSINITSKKKIIKLNQNY